MVGVGGHELVLSVLLKALQGISGFARLGSALGMEFRRVFGYIQEGLIGSLTGSGEALGRPCACLGSTRCATGWCDPCSPAIGQLAPQLSDVLKTSRDGMDFCSLATAFVASNCTQSWRPCIRLVSSKPPPLVYVGRCVVLIVPSWRTAA